MGIHMVSVLETALLSRECFEHQLHSRSGVCTEDDVKLLGISIEKVEHAVPDIIYSFGGFLR